MRIVFDLDGTLVDSAPDLMNAANQMLAMVGKAPLSPSETISFVGNGLPKLGERALLARGVAPAEHPALIEALREIYEAHPAGEAQLYPGVMECLQSLRAAGHRLGLCTNKPEIPALALIDAMGIAGFFDIVIGGDTLPVKKPDPEPLTSCFAALGDTPMLYVGDSEVDAETAVNAGVDFALFTEGYRKSPIKALPHRMRFDHFNQLASMLSDLQSHASSTAGAG
ncbi:MAG: phosphoglycolate phosphatase [Maritimibacter sp.]